MNAPSSPRWRRALLQPVDVAPLVFFRIVLGGLLFWHLLDYFQFDWIRRVWVYPELHVPYPGLEWLQPWSGEGMITHFAVLTAAAAALALGWWTRMAALVCFLGSASLLLMERTHFNNHDYLIVLLAFLSCFLPLERACSLDVREKPALRVDRVPGWTLWALRGQVAVLYFFGAVSKWNSDWLLRGEPFGYRVHAFALEQGWSLAPMLEARAWWVGLSWAGMLFDLLIVPALLWRRTRALAVVATFAFHAINSVLFPIGIFPVLGFCLTLLFLDPSWSRRMLRLRPVAAPPVVWSPPTALRSLVLPAFGLYFAVQCLLPLRPWLHEGKPSWTERGGLFSWRMMISRKQCELEFFATEGDPPRPIACDWRPLLSDDQRDAVAGNPALIAWFARTLRARLEAEGHRDVRIHALARCALNGREPQFLVDPEVDLSRAEGTGWVMPLADGPRDPAPASQEGSPP